MRNINKLSESQNHRCCYCGHEMLKHVHADGRPIAKNAATRDHVEPCTYGGKKTWFNMVAACGQCNWLRGELEAHAFFNVLQKWFKRNPTLRVRWHSISKHELAELKRECWSIHARQLNGLGKRNLEYAFRHFTFVTRWYQYPLRA